MSLFYSYHYHTAKEQGREAGEEQHRGRLPGAAEIYGWMPEKDRVGRF